VVVTNPDTLAASATDKFRYQPKADITSVLPAFGPLAGGTKVTVFGSGFDAIGTVRLKIGGTACLSVVVVSAAELTCTTPAGTLGKKGIEVENVDLNSGSVFVADLFEYADTKSIIARLYANGGSRDIKRMQDLAQKVLDGKGSCSKDLAKFGDELAKLVAAKKMTQATAQTLAAFSFGDCLPQLPAAPPASAPVRAQLAPSPAELLVAPVCTTTLSNSAVTLDLSSPDALLTLYSYSRENFEWAAMWTRIDGGAWGPAIGLSPTNGSGSGIGWSSDLVRSLLQVGGVFRLGGNRTYSVELAVGTGSTGDPYVADAQVCTQTFSVFVGELPITGSNSNGIAGTALWVTLTGALLAAVGIRRRRPTALKR
jgi:hypothetical protein